MIACGVWCGEDLRGLRRFGETCCGAVRCRLALSPTSRRGEGGVGGGGEGRHVEVGFGGHSCVVDTPGQGGTIDSQSSSLENRGGTRKVSFDKISRRNMLARCQSAPRVNLTDKKLSVLVAFS